MGRILFFVLLGIAAYLAWRWMRLQGRADAGAARPPAAPAAEAMVRCAHCGVHLPRSEAIVVAGQTFCCEEHRQLGPRR